MLYHEVLMFISKRFENYELSGELNPIAEAYKNYLLQGKNFFDLTLSNPTKANIHYPETEIIKALSKNTSLLYEPIPKGLPIARESVSQYYASLGFSISPEDIFFTSGTSEAYSYLIKLFCNPGDEILIPAPSYPLLDFIASLELVKVIPYFLEEENNLWTFSKKKVEKLINNNTKLLFFIQPNNPTGNILSSNEIEDLISVSEKHNLAIIIDEVFRDYFFNNDIPKLLSSIKVPVFTLNGISKTLALPQLKLSWIICSCPKRIKKELYEGLEIISDTFLSVNIPAQVALPDLFQLRNTIQSQIKNRINSNLNYALTLLSNNNSIMLYTPKGGWYLVLKIYNAKNSEEETVIDLLNHTGVYVHPGSMFRFPENTYLILSLLPEEHIFREGIKRIASYFS